MSRVLEQHEEITGNLQRSFAESKSRDEDGGE